MNIDLDLGTIGDMFLEPTHYNCDNCDEEHYDYELHLHTPGGIVDLSCDAGDMIRMCAFVMRMATDRDPRLVAEILDVMKVGTIGPDGERHEDGG